MKGRKRKTYLLLSDSFCHDSSKGDLVIRSLWARESITRCKEYSKCYNFVSTCVNVPKASVDLPYHVPPECKNKFVTLEDFYPTPETTRREYQARLPLLARGLSRYVRKALAAMAKILVTGVRADIVHTSASPSLLGVLAQNILRSLGKRSVVVIDADYIGDFDFYVSRSNGPYKILLFMLKYMYYIIFSISVARANIVYVIGYKNLERFHRFNKRVYPMRAAWYYTWEWEAMEKIIKEKLEKIREKKRLGVVFAGKLIEKKGAHLLPELIRMADESKFTFHIYGDGPLRSRLKDLIDGVNVVYEGYKPYGLELFRDFAKHDITLILNLSNEEPRMIYDSWLSGLAVVAPNNPSIAAIIRHGETGLLHNFDIGEILGLLESLYNDRGLLERIIINSRLESRKYSIDKTIRQQLRHLSLLEGGEQTCIQK
ncbi:MAG: glycosyltransferase [Desulfurococcales archaeon]|nr:glycosyltransferase [Desulfurococcales archaeon]